MTIGDNVLVKFSGSDEVEFGKLIDASIDYKLARIRFADGSELAGMVDAIQEASLFR